ncbi:MAG: hypothetical protein ACUVYA_00295 [Planctomycetota bacterium]
MIEVPAEEKGSAGIAGAPFGASYRALGAEFTVRSPNAEVAAAVDFLYAEMRAGRGAAGASRKLAIDVVPGRAGGTLEVFFDGEKAFDAANLSELLHGLDNELTVALELATPALYFVHAAVVEIGGRATILVGRSGSGKSTTAFALAAAGAGYLSDELAPADPETGLVHPYPRALCLKRPPPPPLRLPPGALRTEGTIHVPPESLPGGVRREPCPLGRIVFVEYRPSTRTPSLRRISRGEAALRLYEQALNQLAHPAAGLDSTLALVGRAECCELLPAGIPETLRALRG